MMITNSGTIIRIPVAGVNTYSRSAAGVIVMRLAEGQSIVNFAKVTHEEQEEGESVPAEGAQPVQEAPASEAADNKE
jgi:DNA gyrase subunit A